MICPKCFDDATVIDTVKNVDNNEVYRKLKCKSCGHKFYTLEYEVEYSNNFKKLWNEYHRCFNKRKKK